MTYHPVLAEEARVPLGTEIMLVNALHGVSSVHEGEGVAAYEDRDRRVRVSAYALLRSPKRVLAELMELSRGRWTPSEATVAVARAKRHLRDQSRP